jgi:hypothetical protein
VSLAYRWTVNGVAVAATGSTLSGATYFSRGDSVAVTVTPSDADGAGSAVTSSSVTVSNSAPSAPVVAIDPAAPYAGETLFCEVVGESMDADGDSIHYSYSWTRDGVAFSSTSTTVSTDDTVLGVYVSDAAAWACGVTASDGSVSGWPGTDEVVVDEPILHFAFSGDMVDRGPSGYVAAGVGVSYVTDRHGNPSSAVSFDGIGSYASTPVSFLYSTNTEMTYMAWLYWRGTGTNPYPTAINLYHGPCGGAEASITSYRTSSSALTILGRMASSCYYVADAATTISAGVWTHVAVVNSTVGTTVYVDGVAAGTAAYAYADTRSASGTLYMGGYPSVSDAYFDGAVDEIYLFDRAFSAEEVSRYASY